MTKTNIPNIRKRGMTIIEIILVIAVLSVLSLFIFGWFANYQRHVELNSSAQIIKDILINARSNSINSIDHKQWGVFFDIANNKIVLFRDEGSGYGDGSGILVKEENYLPPIVQVGSVLLNGGGNEIIFNINTGGTAQYGTIRIENSNSDSSYIDISITPIGLINSQ